MIDISSKAIMIRLTMTYWLARKRDRGASNETAKLHQAAERAVSTTKLLMESPPLNEYRQLCDSFRVFYYR
ncbi:hypothetical protein LCGC14_3002350, partial [marine sediment metagenome]